MKRKRILHIITTLSTGGAEMMLYRLLSHMDSARLQSEVLTLGTNAEIGQKIEQLGIRVTSLDLTYTRPNILKSRRVTRLLRRLRPEIIQTWMYHADFFGTLLKAVGLTRSAHMLWNVRHSDYDPKKEKTAIKMLVKWCALFSSRWPTRIIYNSYSGAAIHEAAGYAPSKTIVIGNGFDTAQFKPCPYVYAHLRKQLGLPENAPIVGLVARYHYQKNHEGFLQAAGRILHAVPKAQFVLCGRRIDATNMDLQRWINRYGLSHNVHLLGQQDQMARITPGFDVAVLSATAGEGFPNVIGEAMSCGVPCVVTDVGDSARLVKETGFVVPPHDPESFSRAVIKLLRMASSARQRLGAKARKRIIERYSIKKIAKDYERLYESVASVK